MSASAIRVVLFDVGNVIVRATHAITYAILVDFGVKMDIAPRFFHHSDYADFTRGKLTATEFGKRTRERMGGVMTTPQLYCAHNAHIYDADEGVGVLLDVLRSRGFPLAFATDTNVWQIDRVRELVDLDAYGHIFRSDELGALKADGGVFERILATIGEEPAHVLFVDDSPEKIARAAALGMPTIQFINAPALDRELRHLGVLT